MSQIKGMQELIDKLQKMEDAGNKIANSALREAGEVVKSAEVEEAKKAHTDNSKYSQNVGWKEIKKYNVRLSKKGTKVIDIGLKGSRTPSQKKKDAKAQASGVARATHWDKIKGLYFNNYGFYHNITGEYVAGSNWLGKAYDKSVDDAYEIIRQKLIKEMEL